MGDQQNISQILAALASQREGGTPVQLPPQAGHGNSFPSAYQPPNPPIGAPGYGLPQPSSSGSLDLSNIKPVSSGTVSISDAIAKARGFAAEKGVSFDASRAPVRDVDPRLPPRPYRRSRSPSRTPPRAVRDSYRDSYNPYRDERRPVGDRGFVRDRSYSPRPGGRASSTFSPPPGLGYGVSGGQSPVLRDPDILPIDSNMVGLIIGRSGENLRRVENATGARVQFLDGPEAGGSVRHCKISGTPAAKADARAEIFRIMEENGPSQRGGAGAGARSQAKASNQPALREGENSTQIMVPDRTVGLIIGRGGETIRDLQERSGCHINIVGENKSINGLRPVNLIGGAHASQLAKDLIMEIVDSDTRTLANPSQRDSGRAGAPAASDQGGKMNDSIMVPGDAVGMIIGKGGESIKEMQNTTGCKINVSPASGRDIEREIGLVGTRSAVDAAKRAIMDKVEAVEQKNRAQGGGRRRDEPFDGDPYSQAQQPHAQQGTAPAAQHAPAQGGTDESDPYAAYGGYQNYVAMWYAAMAQQQGAAGQSEQTGAPRAA